MRAMPVRPLHTLNKSQFFRSASSHCTERNVCVSQIYASQILPPAVLFVLSNLHENSLSLPQHLLSHNIVNVERHLKLNLSQWPWLQNMISLSHRHNETAQVPKL